MPDTKLRLTFSEAAYSLGGGAIGAVATALRPLLGHWDLTERLGHGDRLCEGLRPLWLHAASVGELSTLRPIAAEIGRRLEGLHWGLTTTTKTGARAAVQQFPEACFCRLLPLDVWPATDRFLDAIHPGAALFVETELWPRLILSLARRGVPVCLASARLTESSMRGYRRFGALFGRVLQSLDLIATRSEEDRRRFLELGAQARRTIVLGNTKLDGSSDEPPSLGVKAELLARLTAGRLLVVWGSLRPGEEKIATSTIRALGPEAGLFWVLAPRHPTEFDRVAEMARSAGLRTVRWSALDDASCEAVDVLILDTLGELRTFYARADVAIVGGSFDDYGGHNLMEPAGFGVPVLFGPDTGEWPEDTARLLQNGGGVRVRGVEELRETLAWILQDPAGRHAMGESARAAAAAGRGASRRVVETLLRDRFFEGVSRGRANLDPA